MIKKYACGFCHAIFDSKEKCADHEAITTEPHKYEVGEEVVLVVRYPEDEKRFFAKRTIVSLSWSPYDEKYPYNARFIHKPVYELDSTVQTGKALYEGSKTYFQDFEGLWHQPADEVTLHKIGDMFSFWTGEGEGRITRAITIDDINPEE